MPRVGPIIAGGAPWGLPSVLKRADMLGFIILAGGGAQMSKVKTYTHLIM